MFMCLRQQQQQRYKMPQRASPTLALQTHDKRCTSRVKLRINKFATSIMMVMMTKENLYRIAGFHLNKYSSCALKVLNVKSNQHQLIDI